MPLIVRLSSLTDRPVWTAASGSPFRIRLAARPPTTTFGVSVPAAACPNSAEVPSTSKNRSVTSAAGTTELSVPVRTVTSRL